MEEAINGDAREFRTESLLHLAVRASLSLFLSFSHFPFISRDLSVLNYLPEISILSIHRKRQTLIWFHSLEMNHYLTLQLLLWGGCGLPLLKGTLRLQMRSTVPKLGTAASLVCNLPLLLINVHANPELGSGERLGCIRSVAIFLNTSGGLVGA